MAGNSIKSEDKGGTGPGINSIRIFHVTIAFINRQFEPLLILLKNVRYCIFANAELNGKPNTYCMYVVWRIKELKQTYMKVFYVKIDVALMIHVCNRNH